MKDQKQFPEPEEWKIDLPEDPHFHSAVWREIAMRDSASPSNRFRELLDHLLVPRLAIPLASAAIIVVLLGASLHGLRNRERTWDNLGLAYNSAIDPISHTGTIFASPLKR